MRSKSDLLILQARLNDVPHGLRVKHGLGVRQLRRAKVLVSAIYSNNLTSNEAGSIAEQEHGSISDISHITDATNRHRKETHAAFTSSCIETGHTLCATDGAWSNDVRTHTLKRSYR